MYGTDFKGGTEVEIAFGTPVDAGAVRRAVESVGFNSPDVVQVVDNNRRTTFSSACRTSARSPRTRRTRSAALCFTEDVQAPISDPAACPANARATEVKFSAGGDKISTRYDVDPDLEKVKDQVAQRAGRLAARERDQPADPQPRDHRVEIQLLSKGDQLIDRLRDKLGADAVPRRPRSASSGWVPRPASSSATARATRSPSRSCSSCSTSRSASTCASRRASSWPAFTTRWSSSASSSRSARRSRSRRSPPCSRSSATR